MPISAGSPLVSVAMPVRNAERFLEEAIESVLCQTLRDFELLVIDDGSTDGSLGILRRYEAADPRVRLGSRENRGLVATLNEMLDQARGTFLARMDADDVSLEERFARQVAFLEGEPEVVCVGGAFELIDEKGRLLTRLQPPVRDDEIQRVALAGHTPIAPAAMMRRAALEAVGGYDSGMRLVEDLDLYLRLGELGSLANLEETVLRYRLHPGSVSGQDPVEQHRKAREACERAWKRRGIQGSFQATGEWRPSGQHASRHAFLCRCGWWAFGSRQRATAIAYGARAVATKPLAGSGWRLLLCALLKPFPRRP
jgi:glycosyltransferase involved in cell wall biosynthesis